MSTDVKNLYSSNNYCNQTLFAQHCVYKPLKKELSCTEKWLEKKTDQVAESV